MESDNLLTTDAHDEPTVLQLIKYKQQIHAEKDRRHHQEKLAELARQQREKEQLIPSDGAIKAQGIHESPFHEQEDPTVPKPISDQRRKSSHKPLVKSTEEEEILNDENVLQPLKTRERTRQKTPRVHSSPQLTHKSIPENLTCKLCGHVLNRAAESALPGKHLLRS